MQCVDVYFDTEKLHGPIYIAAYPCGPIGHIRKRPVVQLGQEVWLQPASEYDPWLAFYFSAFV